MARTSIRDFSASKAEFQETSTVRETTVTHKPVRVRVSGVGGEVALKPASFTPLERMTALRIHRVCMRRRSSTSSGVAPPRQMSPCAVSHLRTTASTAFQPGMLEPRVAVSTATGRAALVSCRPD